MSLIRDKYRGTTTYIRVLGELVHAAQYRGFTTYQHLAVIMGLPINGHQMSAETGQILGEICEDEVNAGRPMLSAVAVGVSRKPGVGFYDLARQLGRQKGTGGELAFWLSEVEACYRVWRRPLPR